MVLPTNWKRFELWHRWVSQPLRLFFSFSSPNIICIQNHNFGQKPKKKECCLSSFGWIILVCLGLGHEKPRMYIVRNSDISICDECQSLCALLPFSFLLIQSNEEFTCFKYTNTVSNITVISCGMFYMLCENSMLLVSADNFYYPINWASIVRCERVSINVTAKITSWMTFGWCFQIFGRAWFTQHMIWSSCTPKIQVHSIDRNWNEANDKFDFVIHRNSDIDSLKKQQQQVNERIPQNEACMWWRTLGNRYRWSVFSDDIVKCNRFFFRFVLPLSHTLFDIYLTENMCYANEVPMRFIRKRNSNAMRIEVRRMRQTHVPVWPWICAVFHILCQLGGRINRKFSYNDGDAVRSAHNVSCNMAHLTVATSAQKRKCRSRKDAGRKGAHAHTQWNTVHIVHIRNSDCGTAGLLVK